MLLLRYSEFSSQNGTTKYTSETPRYLYYNIVAGIFYCQSLSTWFICPTPGSQPYHPNREGFRFSGILSVKTEHRAKKRPPILPDSDIRRLYPINSSVAISGTAPGIPRL
jgi:hypothetical protein